MLKKITLLFAALLLFVSIYPQTGEANTKQHNAIFDSFVMSNGKVQSVVLQNNKGKTNSYRADNSLYLFINGTATTAEGFKYGMPVTITRNNLGKVTRIEGLSDIEQGTIGESSRQLAGTVTSIDAAGDYINVKLDSGEVREFYVTSETEFLKGTQRVDFSYMYEGDRVKLSFSASDTNTLTEVDIVQDGVLIENIYRATLNNVNSISNRMTVKSASSLMDWDFGYDTGRAFKTFKFNNSTTIYYGNKAIRKNEMRNYRNSNVYFVTTTVNREEIVKKVIIMQNFERTYYDQIETVNTKSQYFKLDKTGTFKYHNGSILVRNGRLVEAASLQTKGSAYVITDGKTASQYTHVVNVTNDSFLSPNLASHELYYGTISSYSDLNYRINTKDMLMLTNNVWKNSNNKALSFSNNTVFTQNLGEAKVDVSSLSRVLNRPGYFYVKDGHIVAAHFLEAKDTFTTVVTTGRLASVNNSAGSVAMQDVTQWIDGKWELFPSLPSIDLSKAMIIKDGKIVTTSELKRSNRIVVLSDRSLNVDIVLINE